LWDNVFCTYQAIDPDNHSLRTKRNIRTAISILEDARIPYELDEDVHVDFGSNVTYSTDKTAIKHITEHPAKHKDNFLELLKDGLTNEKMIQLLQWIAEKPTQVVMDKMIERRLKDELKEQVDSATERIEQLKDQYALLQRRYTALNEGEEQQEIQRLKQQVSEYSSEHRKLALMYKELQVELKQYKLTDKELEDKNRNNLMTEQKEWDVYEKMRDDLQKKSEKSVAQHKKEVEKLNAVYDKKESKYKKEIKALKHQIKVLKVKASKPDSDSDLSSGSDSDSD
jgi:chromosome segregation ATPase